MIMPGSGIGSNILSLLVNSPTMQRYVPVLALGGTIASVQSPNGTITPTLGAEELISLTPIPSDVHVYERTLCKRPSTELRLRDLIRVRRIIDRLAINGASGIVVTQGTDSLEEAAFALNILGYMRPPIVVTGAMQASSASNSDGPTNLEDAIRIAASPEARGCGVLVVMNSEIHAARFVQKRHTVNAAAFKSDPMGPIGWVTEGRVRIPFRPRRMPIVCIHRLQKDARVALFKVAIGASEAALLNQLEKLGYQGAVIEGMGGGHVPRVLLKTLREITHKMPVVFASRTSGGAVLRNTYGFPGSERDLQAAGVIPAGSLDGLKARVLLSLLIQAGATRLSIQRRFSAY